VNAMKTARQDNDAALIELQKNTPKKIRRKRETPRAPKILCWWYIS